MDLNIVTYVACICLIMLIGKMFIVPIKKICTIALSSVFGGVMLFAINLVGQNFGFYIGINVVTSVIVGLLGVPGLINLVVIKLMIA